MTNQRDNDGAKGDVKAIFGVPVSGDKDETGIRLALAVKSAGGNKAVSEKSGIPLRTLARLLAGQEPKAEHLVRVAAACGVSLDWLATGDGSMAGGAAMDGRGVAGVDARQQAIKAALDGQTVPIGPEDLAERPDLAALRQELEDMAIRPGLTDSQRGFADLMLRLAFNDDTAAQRGRMRDEKLQAQLRSSAATFKKAVEVVAWTPPPAFAQALRTLIFSYNISLEDTISTLDALKYGLDEDAASDGS